MSRALRRLWNRTRYRKEAAAMREARERWERYLDKLPAAERDRIVVGRAREVIRTAREYPWG